MLINATTAISTSAVLLVPYSKWHVPQYHEWMKDEEIQEATASEPLTLEEEYAMQQSWRSDADKLTFITCHPVEPSQQQQPLTDYHDSPDRMVGDINLFLRIDDGEEGTSPPQIIGEVELMVAEKRNQRRGFGRASLLVFLRYIADNERAILDEFVARGSDPAAREKLPNPLQLSCLSVKIGQVNARSLALFESVSFEKVSTEPNFFGEFELRRTDLSRGSVDELLGRAGITDYVELKYQRSG
ncbi:hypothetical protein ASPZODRAFT_705466 [Penicilliopsis zonata CBS 506.65]|uniref:N-acetyltransferase domain-containing protein n=1 Tax=Penicilliopsis zonata CBS 506.65 TaxID=1073090 RepID=A0A1L9SBX0_9EURO|nr:hypothetical protein ASPZODRAFT_705466 [Penicilliopsis zonata CBS 506.65]OJJ44642.1 hypothetical protein ASPZODRAFT_705466 [Penicilliopsis zonata CBS 506.65]